MEQKLGEWEQKYDKQFRIVYDGIRQFMTPHDHKQKRNIGVIWVNEKPEQ